MKAHASRGTAMERQTNRTHMLFATPALVMVTCVMFIPMIYNLIMSFCNMKLTAPKRAIKFVGLKNYVNILTDDLFLNAVAVTFKIGLTCVCLELLLGMTFALLLEHRRKFNKSLPGMGALRGIMMMSYLMMPVMVGTTWKLILDPSFGILYHALIKLGFPAVTYFSDPFWAIAMVIVMDTWQCTPMVMLILTAGMKTIDETLYEAAHVDGATWWQSFRRITIPCLKPSLKIAVSMRLMDVLRIYDTIYATTKGGPGDTTNVMSIYVYNKAFSQFETSMAAAAALIVTVIILTVSLFVIHCLSTDNNI